ncbi:MAG: response regulator transcription factor [Chloroflexi bacterium]|nr:response regulator transcription factor [Chloroflexota bacterium]
MSTSAIRLLLADDHSVMRAGLRLLIDAQPDMQTVGEAEDAFQTLAIANQVHPDVILLDLSMPHMSGLNIIHELCKTVPDAHILVLTMHAEQDYVREALRQGAIGYIVKSAADQELLVAIRAVACGDVYVHPSITRPLLDEILPLELSPNDTWETLSDREQQVIRRVILGYTNREIAKHLSVSIKTVETYRYRGMEKLGIHTRVQLVRYAMHRGLLEQEVDGGS